MEVRAQVQSYVIQDEMKTELKLQCNYFTLVERHFRWKNDWLGEKCQHELVTFLAFAITTSAGAFLFKSDVWAHDHLLASWRNTQKEQTSQESNLCIFPKFPQSPIF